MCEHVSETARLPWMDIGRIQIRNPVTPLEFWLRAAATMYPRFFCDTPIADATVRLTGDEAHHLSRVRRIQPGERVVLLDGSGVDFEAEVLEVRRHEVTLQVLRQQSVNRESPVQLTIAVALPKGDRQHFLIEKCVELGAHAVVPLETAFGVARPSEQLLARWRRYVIESSKQCGRNQLMRVEEPQRIMHFLASCDATATRWFTDPRYSGCGQLPTVRCGATVIAVMGPEGGWDEQERIAAEAGGWQTISLGPRILRTETAAMAVAAWCGLQPPMRVPG